MRFRRHGIFVLPFKAATWLAGLHLAAVLLIVFFEAANRVKVPADQMAGLREGEFKIVLFAAVGYGILRGALYFPTRGKRYANWLLNTPWQPGRALPLGPVHLVVEDAIPLLIAWWIGADPMLILLAFGGGYLLTVLVAMCTSGVVLIPLGIAFLVPVVALVWGSPVVVVILAGLILLLSQLGLERSLSRIPWKREVQAAARDKVQLRKSSEWPVAPAIPQTPISASAGWATALLIGWWVFAALSVALAIDPETDRTGDTIMIALPLFGCGLFRWMRYCGVYLPPISTWGRLRTLRWIMPGYDYVLIAPISIMMMGIILPWGLDSAGVNTPLAAGLSVFIVVAATLNLGPTLRRWQLTGHHRIVARQRRARATAAHSSR